MIQFVVMTKPVAQPRPSFSRAGNIVRAYVPKKHPVNEFKTLCRLAAQKAICTTNREMLSCPVVVELTFAMPMPKSEERVREPKKRCWHAVKPDIDNLAKAVMDSLTGVCWIDDRQIVELRAIKYRCAQGEKPYVLVVVKPASDIIGPQ